MVALFALPNLIQRIAVLANHDIQSFETVCDLANEFTNSPSLLNRTASQ
jgi:hypothetical protein